MALPPSLVGQAQSNVDNAMSTGGRGSQTSTTDYTPLANAFMKKAQLDLNIAELHSNNTNMRAEMMSNLDISKANLHMQSAGLALDKWKYDDQVRREEEADKLSGF